MYKEFRCLQGKTQRFQWGCGEVREAMSHPSWEGTGSTVEFVGF